MSLTDAARRLSGRCAVLLGWTPDVFWQSTPAELADILVALVPAQTDAAPPRALIAQLMKDHPDD